MGKRSAVEMLPDDVRRQLDDEIRKSRFSGYTQHSEWLERQGYEISRSSVHRYGKKLQETVSGKEKIEIGMEELQAEISALNGKLENLTLKQQAQEHAFLDILFEICLQLPPTKQSKLIFNLDLTAAPSATVIRTAKRQPHSFDNEFHRQTEFLANRENLNTVKEHRDYLIRELNTKILNAICKE